LLNTDSLEITYNYELNTELILSL